VGSRLNGRKLPTHYERALER